MNFFFNIFMRFLKLQIFKIFKNMKIMLVQLMIQYVFGDIINLRNFRYGIGFLKIDFQLSLKFNYGSSGNSCFILNYI